MARKLRQMADDAGALADNLARAARSMPSTSPTSPTGAGGAGGSGLAAVLQRLDAIGQALGQVGANVAGLQGDGRLALRLGGE